MPIHRFRPATTVPALALMPLPASTSEAAQAQSRDVKLSGMGIRKCSEWQQWKESGNKGRLDS